MQYKIAVRTVEDLIPVFCCDKLREVVKRDSQMTFDFMDRKKIVIRGYGRDENDLEIIFCPFCATKIKED